MPNIFYIDGRYVPDDAAVISATDLAVLRGYGVFDFMRTYDGVPFHLDEHLHRLRRSAELIDLPVPWPHEQLRSIVQETLRRNIEQAVGEYNVRVVVTGGASQDFITPDDEPRLLVFVTPANPIPAQYYSAGVKIITVFTERYVPEAKTLNYIPAIRAMRRARAEGAVEAIYTDRHQRALEGTTTNLFAFFGDTLVTPGADILWGITRAVVLELADAHYTVKPRDLTVSELRRADEVFIAASNKQVMPVIQVDDTIIGTGRPGKRTRHIMELFAAHTAQTATARP